MATTALSTTTRYVQIPYGMSSGLSQIIQTSQNGTTTNFVYGVDRLATESGGTRTWYVGDALGSVRMTLDDMGLPVSAVSYDPWGVVQGNAITPFGFTGELQDASLGSVYLRARWYTTQNGSFLSRDPFKGWDQQPQSLSYYTYVHNDPINATDPTGLWRWSGTSSLYHFVIEQVHMSRNNPVDVHVEYNDTPIYPLRVDVLHSNTGDVYEIEPIDKANDALPQALGYVLLLNSRGLYAGRIGGIPSLAGEYYGWPRPRRVIPGTGVPYNWNTVQWRLGDPANFPMIRIPWLVGAGNAIVPPNMRVADLVAISPMSGTVIYWLEPTDGSVAAALALAGAAWLSDRLKRPYSGSNTPAPAPAPPLPAPLLPAPLLPAPLVPMPDFPTLPAPLVPMPNFPMPTVPNSPLVGYSAC